MEKETTIRITRHLLGCLFLAALAMLTACQTTKPQPQTKPATQPSRGMAGQMRDMAKSVDITGTLEARDAQIDMLNVFRERAEQLDVEGFNEAVSRLQEAIAILADQIESVPPDVLSTTSDNILMTTESARHQVEQARLDETVAKIRETVEQLRQQLGTATIATQDTIDRTRQRIDELPITELRASIVQLEKTLISIDKTSRQLPDMTAQLNATLATAQTSFRMIVAMTLVISLCALAWLIRFLPRRRKPQS